MEYKVTLRNQFRTLGFSLFVLLAIILFIIYQVNENNFNSNLRDGVIVFSLISFLPVLYLHIEYYCYNAGVRLNIEIYGKELHYIHNDKTVEKFSFEELEKIVLFISPNMARGSSFQILTFEPYHYAEIQAKNGRILYVTCLMVSKVQDMAGIIRGIRVEKKKRVFASILLEKLWCLYMKE